MGRCVKKRKETVFLVDASQTAGIIPVSMNDGIDMLGFPGHKGMLGPQGIGVLMVQPGIELPSDLRWYRQPFRRTWSA
nr:aminotransferase class V-fold PLP-dependent enzyme [Alteribacter keqinensis]